MRKLFKNSLLGVLKKVKMQNDINFKLADIKNGDKEKISITFGSKSLEVESREK